MRNLSTEFKEQQNSGNRNYLKYADFTFTDGSTLSITDKDLWSNGFKFEDAVSQNGSFDIGAAIINKLTLQINNFSGKYTDYIWDGARVVCYIGLELSTGIEKIRICTMTVTDAPYQSTAIISLTCEDSMRKFDRDYSESKLTYPATRLQIIQDACEVCGVTLQSTRFDNDDFVIQNRPDDSSITFRQVIAWVAQMGCQWAKSDEYGRLCLGWYEREVPDKFYNLVETPWKDTDGNDILDTKGAQIITIMQKGITSTDTNGFTPWLYDIEITGIKVTEYVENSSQNEAKTYQSGKSGYVIEISDNKLIQEGTGGTICQIIADRCVGMKFRPFSTGALTNIAWEAGDTIAISDRNGKQYKSYLTSVTLNPGAFEQLECSAKSVSRNKQKQYTLSQQVQAENKKNLKDERTAREKAIEDLSNRLAESPGVYTTVEPQLDGSNIYYLHNKPNLADSNIIWKMTAEAWAVSTDGGQHWNGGMTVDGDVIARILTATGVNADWIKTGALVIRDNNGKIIFSADITNHQLIMDGSSIRIGESPLDNLLNDMQGQIDGNINTWTGTSVPTLNNYPANEWLDDTEMSKHVGDVYYDGDSHAYRFVNEGNGYYWKQLKDTDVTKALKDSEDALSAAKQAQEAAALAKNMTLQLSNEYQGISVDSNGNYGTFPSGVTAQAVVMYGTQDITSDCNFTIIKSDGVTGSWNNSTKTYTVTALSTDDGWVDVKATYISVLSVTKRFSISKIYAGGKGEKGDPGRTFFIQLSANVLKRGQNNAVTPATLTANAFYRDGDSAARYPYEGRWKIETSTDGVSYTEVSASTENESIKSYLVVSLQKDIVSVRFTLYEAGGTEHPLDMQSVPIAIDVDNLTHEEIFNLFTDNGKYKGIYKQGNLLLMNADYIQSGTLKSIKLEAVTGDITGEFTSTSTNSWGKEYVKIKDAIITAGLDGTQTSLIDMVAQYADGLHLVIKNDTEINIEAPVLKILTDILNIGDGQISITQKSLAEAQVNVANTDISGRLVASGGGNFGLYNVTTGSWVIKSDKTGITVLPSTTITGITTMLGDAGVEKNLHVGKEAIIGGKTTINNDLEVLGSVDVGKNEYIAGTLEVVGAITNHEKINVTKSDLSEAQIDISNSDISGRLTASAAKNFGLYHITFSKWLIRMGSDGNAYLLDTIFNGTATFNKGTTFAGTATFSKSATFDATASFKKPPKLYNLTNVTSGNHLVMASDGASIAYLGSSSLRYKDVQGAIKESDLESLYQIKVVWAKYKNEYLDASDERYGKEMPMFLAEDIDQHFPLAVDHDEQGRAENWNYRIMIPCMFAMLKNEHEKVVEVKKENEHLKSELQSIKEELEEIKKMLIKQ